MSNTHLYVVFSVIEIQFNRELKTKPEQKRKRPMSLAQLATILFADVLY